MTILTATQLNGSMTKANPAYELYDFYIRTYHETIDRQRIADVIEDITCASSSDSLKLLDIEFQDRHFLYLINLVKNKNRENMVSILEYDLINCNTTLIFDKLEPNGKRNIYGYQGKLTLENLNSPFELAEFTTPRNEIGPTADLMYEQLLLKLDDHRLKIIKESNKKN